MFQDNQTESFVDAQTDVEPLQIDVVDLLRSADKPLTPRQLEFLKDDVPEAAKVATTMDRRAQRETDPKDKAAWWALASNRLRTTIEGADERGGKEFITKSVNELAKTLPTNLKATHKFSTTDEGEFVEVKLGDNISAKVKLGSAEYSTKPSTPPKVVSNMG